MGGCRGGFDDAKIGPEDIQGFVVGNVGGWSSEALPAVVKGKYCGLVLKSGIRVEAAARTAYHIVASGKADIVMVVGVEKPASFFSSWLLYNALV